MRRTEASQDRPLTAKPKRELTDRELAARRANSQKSTGPKTSEGKRRVSQNAIRHGAYAKAVTAITHGPLAEIPEEVDAFYAAIVDELRPDTPIQTALAHDIASLAWRMRRADDWENLALTTVERAELGLPIDWVTFNQDYAQRAEMAARVLSDLNAPDLTAADFEAAASALYCALPDGTPSPGWYPDRGIRPQRSEEWRTLIDGLIAHKWKTRDHAARWAQERAVEPARRYELEREDRAQLAARKAITDGMLDKAMDMKSRLRRDLLKMLKEYTQLKEGN